MPTGQPFTHLCRQLARPPHAGRADLHLHTTASDGTYTPAEVVDLARRSGLSAVAVTDHDTTDGVLPARRAAAGALEVCAGVELTAEFRGAELHLLGYFFDLDDGPLRCALDRLRHDRVGRFWAMVERLRGLGVRVPTDELGPGGPGGTLGRRHLAELLVKARQAGSVRDAFRRYLGDRGRVTVPKTRVPVAEAIALVRGAGGVTAWAHPPADCTEAALRELRDLGLAAVEAAFPSCRPGRGRELRRLAAVLGLAVTGGSDCHGPGQPHRAVGACSVSADELLQLKSLAG